MLHLSRRCVGPSGSYLRHFAGPPLPLIQYCFRTYGSGGVSEPAKRAVLLTRLTVPSSAIERGWASLRALLELETTSMSPPLASGTALYRRAETAQQAVLVESRRTILSQFYRRDDGSIKDRLFWGSSVLLPRDRAQLHVVSRQSILSLPGEPASSILPNGGDGVLRSSR